jgi:hypothetical protein
MSASNVQSLISEAWKIVKLGKMVIKILKKKSLYAENAQL